MTVKVCDVCGKQETHPDGVPELFHVISVYGNYFLCHSHLNYYDPHNGKQSGEKP